MKGLFIPGITAEMLREASLDAVETLIAEGVFYDIDYDPKKKKGKRLEYDEAIKMPSEERKTGHWVEHKRANIVNGLFVSNYECSECHSWEEYDSFYCPSCGSRNKE